jgi:poly-gamma-glutamate capsule biosynthesis protein CapA/YwtB (metallophosphatase superfamily)
MRPDRLIVYVGLMAAYLTGCAAPPRNLVGGSQVPDVIVTLTPFLPAYETPTLSPFGSTSTSTSTETVTLTPTSSPSPPPSLQVELQAVGDIMLARTIGDRVLAQGPEIVFSGVQSIFDSADVLVGNLECALTTSSDPEPKSYTFAAPPGSAQSLALAGFDLLSLANNHAMDYGSPGLFDTRNLLGQFGIASVGAGANSAEAHTPFFLERNGLRLAFLAYVDVPEENAGFDTRTWIATSSQPGIAWADLDQITTDVAKARLQSDLVVVLLHSGYELNTTVALNQRAEARAAIDAGAALVIGSHAHLLQAIEQYHGGLIAYSLGNFVFDDYLGIVNATVILRVVLTPAGVQSYDWMPVLIENGLPRLAAEWEAPAIGTMVAPLDH